MALQLFQLCFVAVTIWFLCDFPVATLRFSIKKYCGALLTLMRVTKGASNPMNLNFCRVLPFAILILCLPARGATYYVATNGADSNPGTLALPWRTVQKAASTLGPGDTALVRGGIYSERVTVKVSGSAAGGMVTLQNYPGETPIVDGTGLSVPTADTGLFLLINRSYVVIKGFEIRNYKTANSALAPAGIQVIGASNHIQLRNNNIHHIENNFNGADANAFGIAAYGTSSAQSLNNLVIDGNDVHNLKTGSSESVVLNGNVEQFRVTNNRVHDNNNIGIDFIGFEGTCPTAALDQARNGVCQNNTVWNIDTKGNPAYLSGGQYDLSADGIYVDGGKGITIERNLVSTCDIGIEVASEHSGHFADAVLVRDNVVHHCLTEGISTGGYASSVGWAQNCVFTNNTLFQNDSTQSGSGELLLQYKVTNCTFKNNILQANAQNLLIGNPFGNSGNVVDYNLYFAPGGLANSEWQWKNAYRTGFSAYKTFSGNDAHSLFANPQFVGAAALDFHLAATSPALNAGDPAFAAGASETDFDGAARLQGARVDLGAFEGLVITLSVANAPAHLEGSAISPGSTNFSVTLSAPSTQSVTVRYHTTNAAALAGSDYIAKSGTLTFAPGETLKRVTITFIGDSVAEPDETFFFDLDTPTNATIADNRGTTSIRNDDAAALLFENDEPSQ